MLVMRSFLFPLSIIFEGFCERIMQDYVRGTGLCGWDNTHDMPSFARAMATCGAD